MKSLTSIAALSLAVLVGCTTGQDFDAKPYDIEFRLDRNYQAAYAGIYGAMRACYAGATIIIQTARVEGQLYPDLGYGEIYHGTTAVIPLHHSSIRIEKAGSGSLVKIKSGDTGQPTRRLKHAQHLRQWAEYWAGGRRGCPRVGALNPPAAS